MICIVFCRRERNVRWLERALKRGGNCGGMGERDTGGTYLQLSGIGGISGQRGCTLGVEAS
jgi:hypothetical protein